MYSIKPSGSSFRITHFPWKNEYPATPLTEVRISYDSDGYDVHFVSYETKLRAVETEPNSMVYRDSCMEMFMQFAPDTDPRYINFEINPNGAVYSAISYDRAHSTLIDQADIAMLDIKTRAFADRWEIDCRIPVTYIQKQIPTYRHGAGAHLRGNFYKCGDETDHPHYGCFADIDLPEPDFHCPQFFTDFVLSAEITGIHHVALKCCGIAEFERTVYFYRDLLGLCEVRRWGEGENSAVMLDTGEGLLEIFANGAERLGMGALRHIALATPDTDACIEAVRAAGYRVISEPVDICIPSVPPYPARIAFCEGPVGEEVEFFSVQTV